MAHRPHLLPVSLLALLALLLLSGCTPKITIEALEPAEISQAAATQSVAISPFERDRVGLADRLTALMAAYELHPGERYFRVVERDRIELLLEEQRLQHSGLVDESKMVEIGRLAGAEALIAGGISSAGSSDSSYREERTECLERDGRRCVRERRYSVRCTRREVDLSAQIRMVSIEQGELIAARSYDEGAAWSHCQDQSGGLPSVQRGHALLADRIAQAFVAAITPRFYSYDVELIDKLDVSIPKPYADQFDAAIDFIKADRLDRGKMKLANLHRSTAGESYAIAYNLGLMHEADGELEQARALYRHADSIATSPVEAISTALMRIDRLITQRDEALSQMGNR